MYFILLFLSFSWHATISGIITNSETKKSIPNANVIIKEIEFGVASSPYGYYKINIPEGQYTLEVSVIGFKTFNKKIDIYNNIELNISLNAAVLEYDEVHVQGLLNTRMGSDNIDIIEVNKIKSMGKDSFSDLLKNIKGIDAQFSHPNGRNVNVSIRGSSDYKPGGYNNRILILLDGFPVLIPNSGSPDWSSLPLENLQRVEINNTAASTQYGQNSMGGVINLITNDKTHSKIKFSAGSHDSKQMGFIHIKEKLNWTYGSNIFVRSSSGHRYNADDKISRLQSFIKFRDYKGRNYKLSYLLSLSELGHPGFDIDNSNKYRRSNRISQYLQIKAFYPIRTGFSMSHAIFINKFNTKYSNRTDIPKAWLELRTLDKETNYDDISLGLRSEMIITKFSRWVFMMGYDIDLTQSDIDLLNQIYDKPSQQSIGSFFQSKYSIGNGFNFNVGIRYDYRNTIPGNDFPNRIYNHFTPKVSIGYSDNFNNSFNFSFSKGFRAPSISELYLNHITTYGLIVKGNPDLLPENANSYEMTYKNSFNECCILEFALFHNKYENMIDFVYNVPTQALNRKDVISRGFDVSLQMDIYKNMNINANYSFLDMKDLSKKEILYRSKHKGKIVLEMNMHLFNLSLGSLYQSNQYYEDFLDEFDYSEGFPIKELPEVIIAESILSKTYHLFTYKLIISNIFDKKYELIQNYTMPGRTLKFSVTYKIN